MYYLDKNKQTFQVVNKAALSLFRIIIN